MQRLHNVFGVVPQRLRGQVRNFYAAAGLFLCVGLALALLGLFGLTKSVLEGETLRFDGGVLRWMNARAKPRLDVAALEITALRDTLVVLTIAVVSGSLLGLLGRVCAAGIELFLRTRRGPAVDGPGA